jgi:hypothetical protein
MLEFFKKSKKREFYQRMEKCRKAWDFLSKNNPFEAAPAKYSKNSKILVENKIWINDNLEDLKKFLDNSQLQEVRKAFGFPYTLEWVKEEEN